MKFLADRDTADETVADKVERDALRDAIVELEDAATMHGWKPTSMSAERLTKARQSVEAALVASSPLLEPLAEDCLIDIPPKATAELEDHRQWLSAKGSDGNVAGTFAEWKTRCVECGLTNAAHMENCVFRQPAPVASSPPEDDGWQTHDEQEGGERRKAEPVPTDPCPNCGFDLPQFIAKIQERVAEPVPVGEAVAWRTRDKNVPGQRWTLWNQERKPTSGELSRRYTYDTSNLNAEFEALGVIGEQPKKEEMKNAAADVGPEAQPKGDTFVYARWSEVVEEGRLEATIESVLLDHGITSEGNSDARWQSLLPNSYYDLRDDLVQAYTEPSVGDAALREARARVLYDVTIEIYSPLWKAIADPDETRHKWKELSIKAQEKYRERADRIALAQVAPAQTKEADRDAR